MLSEWVVGSKISVGAPFFNKVNVPIALFLLFLTGVGPLLAWRKTSTDALKRNFLWPSVGGVLAGAVAFGLGFRQFYPLVCLILSIFVVLTIFSEFYRGARVIAARENINLLAAVGELTMRNTRRYGGYVIHLGIVMIFIGIAGSAFNKDVQSDMHVGQSMTIGPYSLLCQNFDSLANDNYQSARATLEVFKNGKSQMMLYPERRFFPASGETETIVAIRTEPIEDLYVVYAGQDPQDGNPVIHAFLNPLVKWIWFGGIVVVLGTGLAMLPNRRTATALASVPEKSWDEAVAPGTPVRGVAAVTRGANAND